MPIYGLSGLHMIERPREVFRIRSRRTDSDEKGSATRKLHVVAQQHWTPRIEIGPER